jgi:hypothetical protein
LKKIVTILLFTLLALLVVSYIFRQLSWSRPLPPAVDRMPVAGQTVTAPIEAAGYAS